MSISGKKIIPPVLYKDESLIAIDKPPGYSVLGERDGAPDLLTLLRDLQGENVAVVHRLDKDTSGVLLFALTENAAREISRQFQEREVSKMYLALVRGEPFRDEWLIDLSLAPTGAGNRMRVTEKGKGKESSTRVEVAERFAGFALVRAFPETGRKHQIRVHLRADGLPLAVDPVYGGAEALYLSEFRKGYTASRRGPESPLLSRLSLHAACLTFRHPVTKEYLTLEAPLPKDIERALRALRKYAV